MAHGIVLIQIGETVLDWFYFEFGVECLVNSTYIPARPAAHCKSARPLHTLLLRGDYITVAFVHARAVIDNCVAFFRNRECMLLEKSPNVNA